MPRLNTCRSAAGVLPIVHEEFVRWFDEGIAGTQERYKEIAAEIWQLWQARAKPMKDEYDLKRFVDAQSPMFEQVCAELRAGQKQSHWMWFIFPQLAGLGSSSMATRFGIASRQEAIEYLKHPLLGPRLRECTRLVNLVEGRSIDDIFGYPDNFKFHSSMTLFANATPENKIFGDALQKYFAGKVDPQTMERL